MKPSQRRVRWSLFPPGRAECILRAARLKWDRRCLLEIIQVSQKHAPWLLQHVTACETSDALQEIHDQQIKDDSFPIPSHRTSVNSASPFREKKKKNTGKRNLKGPGVASRLQLCGIASTAHPPVCTSRRENAFVATGCFNIHGAVSDWCCAESSQMFVSLSRAFAGDAGLSAS